MSTPFSSRTGASLPPHTHSVAAVFQEKANAIIESAHSWYHLGGPTGQACCFQGLARFPLPALYYGSLALLVSSPTLWPQHHLMPSPASPQFQMPNSLSLFAVSDLDLNVGSWFLLYSLGRVP